MKNYYTQISFNNYNVYFYTYKSIYQNTLHIYNFQVVNK